MTSLIIRDRGDVFLPADPCAVIQQVDQDTVILRDVLVAVPGPIIQENDGYSIFLKDVGGVPGSSAYEVAVENGFVGTQAQWLASLKGVKGDDGDDGTDGADGNDGTDGADGASAYQVALAGGFVGTQAQWLASLVGAPGADGTDGVDGADGTDGTNGTNGTNGASAYQVALANGFVGTQAEWLASLQGSNGTDGADGTNGTNGLDGADGTGGTNGTNGTDGASAYEIALAGGFVGTQAQWLASLVGAPGADGIDGTNGTNGTDGADGVDVVRWSDIAVNGVTSGAQTAVTGGARITYAFEGSTYYRFIPAPYAATGDAFYSDIALTTLVVARG